MEHNKTPIHPLEIAIYTAAVLAILYLAAGW